MKLENDLVQKYEELYEGTIRTPEEEWTKMKAKQMANCESMQNQFANDSHFIFNSYSSFKPIASKRTFVLWKMNSDCAVLDQCGYCMRHGNRCSDCIVHQHAQHQLELIDSGADEPTGDSNNKITNLKKSGNRLVFNYGGHHVEVLISEPEPEEEVKENE